MKRSIGLVAIALALVAAGCDGGEPQATGDPEKNRPSASSPRHKPSSEPKRDESKAKERKRTRPDGAVLTITAQGRDANRVRRAVGDLKELGFWGRLTKPVAEVRISTRAGEGTIPEDGHLADALRNVRVGGSPGWVCDVMLFTDALAADVSRQETYYAEGRLSAPAPTLRQFWAVVLAHEVAHCSEKGQKGEAYSTRWETRVLDAYDSSRLGSP